MQIYREKSEKTNFLTKALDFWSVRRYTSTEHGGPTIISVEELQPYEEVAESVPRNLMGLFNN